MLMYTDPIVGKTTFSIAFTGHSSLYTYIYSCFVSQYDAAENTSHVY